MTNKDMIVLGLEWCKQKKLVDLSLIRKISPSLLLQGAAVRGRDCHIVGVQKLLGKDFRTPRNLASGVPVPQVEVNKLDERCEAKLSSSQSGTYDRGMGCGDGMVRKSSARFF